MGCHECVRATYFKLLLSSVCDLWGGRAWCLRERGKNVFVSRGECKRGERRSRAKVGLRGYRARRSRGGIRRDAGRRVGSVKRIILGDGSQGRGMRLLAVVNRIRNRRSTPSRSGAAGCRRMLPGLTVVRSSRRVRNLLVLLGAIKKSIRTKLTVTRVVTSLDVPAISLILNNKRSVKIPVTMSTSCSFTMPDTAVIVRPMHSGNVFVKITRACQGVRGVRSHVAAFVSRRSETSRGHLRRLVLSASRLMGSMKAVLRKGRTMGRKLVSRINNVGRTLTGLCRVVRGRY